MIEILRVKSYRAFLLRRRPATACALALCLAVGGSLTAGELHDSAIKGDMVRMQSLLNQNPRAVNEANADGDTPLHCAALTGQNMAAQFLLDNGADANSRNTLTGATPLLAAAMIRLPRLA